MPSRGQTREEDRIGLGFEHTLGRHTDCPPDCPRQSEDPAAPITIAHEALWRIVGQVFAHLPHLCGAERCGWCNIRAFALLGLNVGGHPFQTISFAAEHSAPDHDRDGCDYCVKN